MRSISLLRRFSTLPGKVTRPEIAEVYPAINLYTKDLMIYPAHYGQLANKCLKLKNAKKHHILYDSLPDFLDKQKAG